MEVDRKWLHALIKNKAYELFHSTSVQSACSEKIVHGLRMCNEDH